MDIAKMEGHMAAARVEFNKAPGYIKEKLQPLVIVLQMLVDDAVQRRTDSGNKPKE